MISLDERIEQIISDIWNAGREDLGDTTESEQELKALISSILDELIPDRTPEPSDKFHTYEGGHNDTITQIEANRKRMGL